MHLHDSIMAKVLDNLSPAETAVLTAVNKEFRDLCKPVVKSLSTADKIRHVISDFCMHCKPRKCSIRVVLVSKRPEPNKLFILENLSRHTGDVEIRYGNLAMKTVKLKDEREKFNSIYLDELDSFVHSGAKGMQEIIIWVRGVSVKHKAIQLFAAKLYFACDEKCKVYELPF